MRRLKNAGRQAENRERGQNQFLHQSLL
jgi:hypothetical protein